jgi:hypothetical protein
MDIELGIPESVRMPANYMKAPKPLFGAMVAKPLAIAVSEL